MKKHRIVEPAEILLPRADTDLEKWACLACDQFTSQPEYWQQAEALAELEAAGTADQVDAQLRAAYTEGVEQNG